MAAKVKYDTMKGRVCDLPVGSGSGRTISSAKSLIPYNASGMGY